MINDLNIFLCFILFIAIGLISWWILKKFNFYNWKINLSVLFLGLGLLFLVGWLLNKYTNLTIMLLIGSFIMAPYTMYFVVATQKWLAATKNIEKIYQHSKEAK